MLQSRALPANGKIVPIVSDFFDFSVHIDSEEEQVRQWYVQRFMKLRETAFRDPTSFFKKYAAMDMGASSAVAEGLWENINLRNLRQNILPTHPRAELILRQGCNHFIEAVSLRRL